MRVQFTRRVASPTLNARPGEILDLSDDEALMRIEAGHCTAVDQPKQRLRDRLPGRRKPEPEQTPPPGDTPLEKLTVEQLKAHADKHKIDLGDASKKADILAAIAAAEE
ncbi:hypothetical protein [Streptomyces liliifuscus]|uniref:Rho termination factor N-terminal domain-containing protein n=1 Tax=Streptomyces liliifuscus TaxID=2797636 RepID=A0A7T7L208_9ACTN|nr:hypothetical protein [Streptomyces liliifuscus]QQM45005.1 hypothetical protein JEQ17_40110 [Streptomyces liliifuscus]